MDAVKNPLLLGRFSTINAPAEELSLGWSAEEKYSGYHQSCKTTKLPGFHGFILLLGLRASGLPLLSYPCKALARAGLRELLLSLFS
jgi:hypothetical protein